MFADFYADVPGVRFLSDQPWTLYEMPELRTVVAALNSTMAESHREEDHYGYCGEEQLQWFADRLRRFKEEGWLRIGVMHHNPEISDETDEAFLRDRDRFTELLAPSLNLLLHGHTHQAALCSLGPDGLPVLCAGSAGVRPQARPAEVPNQYQLIRITAGHLEVYGRRYNPSRRRWEGDTGIGKGREEWVRRFRHQFEDVHGIFPDPHSADDRSPADPRHDRERSPHEFGGPSVPRDDLLARLQEICTLHWPEARIERIAPAPGRPQEYLRVTKKEGPAQISQFPIGAFQGTPTREDIAVFIAQVDARLRPGDPTMVSHLVYEGEPVPDELRLWAGKQGVWVRSLLEFEGVVDLRPYAKRQAERLAADESYLPELYVPQRYTLLRGRHDQFIKEPGTDLLARLQEWVADPEGRFVVLLGEFGHGKTFALRELARRIHEEGRPPVVPIFIQLRALEKTHSLEELLAVHLTAGGEQRIDHPRLQYLIREGRVLLLFDGFDELALRVTYDQAAEHLGQLVRAATGRAKVVLTSRTQYFLSDKQVETALSERTTIPGRQLVKLQGFNEDQILAYLTKCLKGDEVAARSWFELLDEVKDLLGLSANPRMLGFITRLERTRLERIRAREGEISAARLYRELLDQWLGYEYGRAHMPGSPPTLSKEERWEAVRVLALRLWESGEDALGVADLSEVAAALRNLAERQLTPEQAAHMIGSGTLLTRSEDERFSFVHGSVMEWLVAEEAARRLTAGEPFPALLSQQSISELMADFLCTLAGEQTAVAWAERVLASGEQDNTAKINALLLWKRRRRITSQPSAPPKAIRLSGADIQGRDLSALDLRNANLNGADLRDCRLDNADLTGADLTGADLRNASLNRTILNGAILRSAKLDYCSGTATSLSGADLRDASLEAARLFQADLRLAKVTGSRWQRAALLGAVLDDGALDECDTAGAALPPFRQPRLETSPSRQATYTTVAWSPDGKLITTASDDGTARIWDTTTGQTLHTLHGHTDWVSALAWHPNGHHLATASRDGAIRIWDITSGTPLSTLLPLQDGTAVFDATGLIYKVDGTVNGEFWWSIGLCRFEPGELDPYLPELRRIPWNAPIPADREG